MSDGRLTEKQFDELRQANLTYGEVGQTQGMLPSGYHHLHHRVTIGAGLARFDEASQILLGWDMHRRSGLDVWSSSEWAAEGSVAVLRLSIGVAAVKAPVRVVYVLDEPHRRGFAYGTIPGHPESGEEAFVVELHDDERVTFTISAFSRPSSRMARIAGPAGRAVQRWVTHRYLRSLQPHGSATS